MKKTQSFGSKLAAGMVDVSRPTVSWWPRHCAGATHYIAIRATDPEPQVVEQARGALGLLSNEWERAVVSAVRRRAGSSLGLMCEHSVLEVALVDASFNGDPEGIERAAGRLTDNASAHAGRYAKAIKDFPKSRFDALMKDHISIFVGMVQALLENDRKLFERHEKQRDENAAAMAAFTAEWF